MQTNNKMAVAPVGKLIWQMSIPPLISMFLQYSYNLIDSAFVARLSENALTAVSLSFPKMCIRDRNRVYYEYYHLDGTQEVPADYKEISFVCLRPDGSLEPVSYTHLDVYK